MSVWTSEPPAGAHNMATIRLIQLGLSSAWHACRDGVRYLIALTHSAADEYDAIGSSHAAHRQSEPAVLVQE